MNVIIEHGNQDTSSNVVFPTPLETIAPPNAFQRDLLHEEFVPVFVSDVNACDNLQKIQLIAILKGETTQWEQLGCGLGRITLYLHGGDLQRKTAQTFFKTLGIEPEALAKSSPSYVNTYQDLAVAAAKDPHALVIGLREFHPPGLKTVSVDGHSLADQANYPLRLPIYIHTRSGDAGAADTRDRVVEIIRQHADQPAGSVK
ncbi:MAG: hypothetical protein WC405_08755 [Syntrophales bacterium]